MLKRSDPTSSRVTTLRKATALCILLVAIGITTSCIKEYDLANLTTEVKGESSFAVPIASSTLTITQLYPSSSKSTVVRADKDSLLHIYYSQPFDTISYDELIGKIPNQFNELSLLPTGAILPEGVTFSRSLTAGAPITPAAPDQIIQSISLAGGLMEISIQSTNALTSSSQIKIASKDIRFKGGGDLNAILTPSKPSIRFNLDGATITPSAKNEVIFSLSAAIAKLNHNLIADQVKLFIRIVDLKSNAADGYFGNVQRAVTTGKIKLEFNRNVFDVDEADLENPMVSIDIDNSFDVPFEFRCSNVDAYIRKTLVEVTGFPATTPIAAGYSGKPARSILLFKQPTNIVPVLAKFPEYIDFKGSVIANPNGNIRLNHAQAGDRIIVKGNLDLPLCVKLKNLVFRDTSHYDFKKLSDNADRLETLKLAAIIRNGFPADLLVNMYIADNSYSYIDSLFDAPTLVKSADITNKKGVAKTETTVSVVFSKERIKKLGVGKHVILVARASTPAAGNNTMVKILSSYSINAKLVGATKYNLNDL